eukprot:TRINITY_DN3373_c1_g1_i10.p2 TRINITY_DN3373_c1_g1~~TRINITY_DN3373_c1_g1_i10.p2  ORF type:complete len:475 (+),score=48.21 TRINITY_DN3373_c1_g1_i10:76-1425(+)
MSTQFSTGQQYITPLYWQHPPHPNFRDQWPNDDGKSSRPGEQKSKINQYTSQIDTSPYDLTSFYPHKKSDPYLYYRQLQIQQLHHELRTQYLQRQHQQILAMQQATLQPQQARMNNKYNEQVEGIDIYKRSTNCNQNRYEQEQYERLLNFLEPSQNLRSEDNVNEDVSFEGKCYNLNRPQEVQSISLQPKLSAGTLNQNGDNQVSSSKSPSNSFSATPSDDMTVWNFLNSDDFHFEDFDLQHNYNVATNNEIQKQEYKNPNFPQQDPKDTDSVLKQAHYCISQQLNKLNDLNNDGREKSLQIILCSLRLVQEQSVTVIDLYESCIVQVVCQVSQLGEKGGEAASIAKQLEQEWMGLAEGQINSEILNEEFQFILKESKGTSETLVQEKEEHEVDKKLVCESEEKKQYFIQEEQESSISCHDFYKDTEEGSSFFPNKFTSSVFQEDMVRE